MLKIILIIIYGFIGYKIAENNYYSNHFGKVKVVLLWPIFIIINPTLNLIDFLCGGKLPKMSCYGCLKEDCKNRSYYENKLCKGYKKRENT